MFLSHPHSPGPATPSGMRGWSWAVLALTGVLVLTALAWAVAGLDPWQLVGWLGLGVIGALVFGAIATCHPLLGHPEALHLWRARFPTHAEVELQRFLCVVGEALEYQAPDWNKPRPEDDLGALKHRWNGGDEMELVELVMAVEREYSLELPEEFLSTTKTLGDLFAQVTRAAAGESAPADGTQTRSQA